MFKLPKNPHAETIINIYKDLQSNPNGLNADDAFKRLQHFGHNTLKEEDRSILEIFLGQFKSPIVAILIAATILSYIMGHTTDSYIIIGILLINSLLGFIQEYRAENSIKALKKLTETHIKVIRQGIDALVPSNELVPGDIVFLSEGDLIAADIRLIESFSLQVDEATLTGESLPVSKHADSILSQDAFVYERQNMLFSGTHILRGNATGIVTSTGESTYLATIAKSARELSPHSPLTRSLAIFSKRLIILLSAIMVFVGITGILQGRSIEDMVSIMIAELVSAVPEGLPIVVTLILALGAYRLSRHNVLVRHLPSVESLGSTSVIATDKTGTITEGFLSVKQVHAIDDDTLKLCAALCNDAKNDVGDSVDTALERWVKDQYETLRKSHPRIFVHPFDPILRMMATVNQYEGQERFFVKGAYEAIRAIATNSLEELEKLEKMHDSMAVQGLRVLVFGFSDEHWEDPSQWQIRIVGAIGFADAAKKDAADAVIQAKQAGIHVIMVTGDNPLTARVIATEVGIYTQGDTLLSGHEIETLDDDALDHALQYCTVIARALPEHKYRIVKRLQSSRHIVAVTGDGVNDVPALKAADLGIAMGNGSEAAKSTAKMVITDNRLGVIVDAIRQGRIISANLRKVIFYLIATCFDEILLITGAILMALPLPVHPTQILWINIVTDGVIDKTFPMCKEEGNVMKRPPKKLENQFFDRWQIARIAWVAVVNATIALSFFYNFLITGHSYESALTVSFCIIVTSQWVNGILAQKEFEPFLMNIKESLTLNPAIWIGLGIGVLLQAAALYLVPQWFHSVTPTKDMLLAVAEATLIIFILIEGYKWGEWFLKRKQMEKSGDIPPFS